MNNFELKPGLRGLVIVAHPDDETIWLSGTVMLNPKIDWTILCLCRASDPDRAPKYFRILKALGAKGSIEDLDDLDRWPFQKHVQECKRQIKKHTTGLEFDFVITHGTNGEYGHRDHKSVHEAVYDLCQRGILKTSALLLLNYKKPNKKIPLLIPRTGSDMLIELPKKIYERKKQLMHEIYGFAIDGIDASYCTQVEAFKIRRFK
jgi:LmbE family N-acetylglucosaminyl deacetylase